MPKKVAAPTVRIDPAPAPAARAPETPKFPAFRIIREKLYIAHDDPLHRRLQIELHLRFEGKPGDVADHFVMILDRYLPGLRVENETGCELSYLPYHEIQKRIGYDPKKIIEARLKHPEAASILWIELNADARAGDVVIIRLVYHDPEPPARKAGLWLIRSPVFWVDEGKEHEDWNTNIEVHGPPGSHVSFAPSRGLPAAPEVTATRGNGWRDFGRFVQVRAARNSADIEFSYRIRPFLSERILIRTTFAMLAGLPLLFLLGHFVPAFVLHLGSLAIAYPPDVRLAGTVAAVGVPAMLAIIALAPTTWVNRLWYGFALFLYVLLLVWEAP